ncbi:MAG: T9SS type A sorting domain-containing protein [Candidatus Latescibacterota bacterium]
MLHCFGRTARTVTVLAALLPAAASAAVVQVSDNDIQPGQSVTWTADNTYVLNGFVFVDEGATLTIEAGTVVKGKPGQGESASALIVARGGRIDAQGTAASPVIFTAEADDVASPSDLPRDARGLWGGVILLGRARLNSSPGETPIEGIPTTEPRGMYGGTDDADNSGVLRYVSIRHGGTDIGAGNEINGLTMGAIGAGTTIEYVEVYNNQDDGFEFFGGTVNTRYLISAFNGDDAFDYDEGFRGQGQFWFAIQDAETGNRGAEQDGGTTPEDGQPYAIPQIYNATYIGSGMASANADNDLAMIMRDNAGGRYYNSIFTDFPLRAVGVEDLASGEDSRLRLEAGDLVLANNLWWDFGAGSTFAELAPQFVAAHLTANNNRIADPQLAGISRANDGRLDPRPSPAGPAYTGLASVPSDGFLQSVAYAGAFGSTLWPAGWSFLSQSGMLAAQATVVAEEAWVEAVVPAAAALAQNSPNPFNPSTTIIYSLPASGPVRLTVFDGLGQHVATLVDGVRPAGTYEVRLEAADLASGRYYYRLQTPAGALSRGMVLLK